MSFTNDINRVCRTIEGIYAERRNQVAEILNNYARSMLRDFRQVQYSAPHVPKYSKSKKNRADTAEDREKAMDYARSHSGGGLQTVRGVPWINRSFRAARSLISLVEVDDQEAAVGLYHTMSYGAYLEFAFNRRYAVIEPIIRANAPQILADIKALYG
jgi:hypothetical protein